MNIAFTIIEQNVGMSFENIIVLVFLGFGGLIFMARDFQLGILITMFLSACTFAWFYYADYNYVPALVVTLLNFVFLCLSYYATQKSVQRGAFI